MSDRERTDDGRFTEEVSIDGVKKLFDEIKGPVLTTSDVAAAFDCSTEAARQKLGTLTDRGEVDSRETGRTIVYWLTDRDADTEN